MPREHGLDSNQGTGEESLAEFHTETPLESWLALRLTFDSSNMAEMMLHDF